MFIQKISIKRFRSIVDESFEADNLTVFVGKNDVGKSNILRAINLFFNNQTDVGQDFDFESDFSRIAPVTKKKAKEIIIELVLTPPNTFKGYSKKLLWTKKWRAEGSYEPGERMRFSDGTVLPDKSRLRVWLRRLRYHYVPAIKSNDYFGSLLKTLYETLYLTIKKDLQGAGQDFIGKIREHTEPLSAELFRRLSLDSKIQLPEDLSNLFSTLDFETTSSNHPISLKHRGDGIKVRHLPVILQFLADKERLHHIKGAVRSDTLWGYEEPENNLELLKAFELASDFEKYSNEIQIFLTTHSPAFYTIGKHQQKTIKYNAFQDTVDASTKVTHIPETGIKTIDENMGLLPIVAPYIEEKMEEIVELNKTIADLKDEKKPILFVEGPTDKTIMENAWQKLRKNEKMTFRIQPAFDRFFIANTFRRCDIFKNDKEKLFAGMLDFDEAFEDWQRVLTKGQDVWEYKENNHEKGLLIKHKKHKAFLFLLPVPPHRLSYANEGYGKMSRLPIELLFTDDILTTHIEDIDLPGGVRVKKFKDEKKAAFAEKTKDFNADDFAHFKPIFVILDKINSEVAS